MRYYAYDKLIERIRHVQCLQNLNIIHCDRCASRGSIYKLRSVFKVIWKIALIQLRHFCIGRKLSFGQTAAICISLAYSDRLASSFRSAATFLIFTFIYYEFNYILLMYNCVIVVHH